MRYLRAAWVVLAIVILGLDAAGIPYAYEYLASPCTLEARACLEGGRLTPQDARELEEEGIARSVYAAYQGIVVETTFTLVCFAVALVIFLRRSDERMALFTSFVLLVFGGAGAAGTMHELSRAHPAFWFPTTLLDYVSQVCFGILFYLFPDGRFVPRWTRWVALMSAVYWIPATFLEEDWDPGSLYGAVFFAFLLSLVVAQVYRYRRVSTISQRQQTKWVVFAFAVALVAFSALLLVAELVPEFRNPGPLTIMIQKTLAYGLLLLIPCSFGVAILRSRLYDIDLIINRTLVYGSLTVMIGLMYFGGVSATQALFRVLTGQEQQPQLVVVASTLAIAALFNPLRRRIQALVDHRFYRRKYDAAKTLEAFSIKLRDETDLQTLNNDLVGVVRETMQPAHVSLWLRSETVTRGEQTH